MTHSERRNMAGWGKPERRTVIRRPPPKPPKKGCCPMVAAVRSIRRGRFRLASRYARMSVRLIAGRTTA